MHASFRLAEMDEERRLGEGRLAQLAGPSELPSDEFELRLGLLRTASGQPWLICGSSASGATTGLAAGATARVIAALAGLPPHAVVGVVVMLLLVCLQAVVGLWLGRALTPPHRSR